MQDTLAQALAALFDETTSKTTSTSSGAADERAREALAHFNRALERLKAGDWSGFGSELDALGPLLERSGGERPRNQK
jgi:uncharacterized membrane protein (UPF0182 family)